jgi:hypothetical protein
VASDAHDPASGPAHLSDAVPAPAWSDVDALIDAIADGRPLLLSRPDDEPDEALSRWRSATQRGSRAVLTRFQALARQASPALAFVACIFIVLWALRTFESHRTSTGSRPATSNSVVRQSRLPSSTDLVSASVLPSRSLPSLAAVLPRSSRARLIETVQEKAASTIVTELSEPERVAMATAPPPLPATIDRVPLAAIEALPANLPAATVPLAAPALPALGSVDRPDTARASSSGAAPLSTAALEERALRQALQEYEEAYEGLDVVAAAHVWPSVDRRALARAFSSLKSQGLSFDRCSFTITGIDAVARCHGTTRYVRKIGDPAPLVERHDWIFNMRKVGSEWKIDAVTTDQASGWSARRARDQS